MEWAFNTSADRRIVEDQSTAETVYQQAAHGGTEGCSHRKAATTSYGTAARGMTLSIPQ
jgi:hypothetical protein